MKKIIQSVILILILMVVSFNILAEGYVKGKHYVSLNKPVKTVTGDKVEVRELFWYYCSYCFNLTPVLSSWIKTLPDSAMFVRQPVVFSDRWMKGAIFYYVLQQLSEVKRLHEKLFEAIHIHKISFTSQEDFINWLVDHNVDMDKANNAFKSFSVRIKVNQSKLNTLKYQISGTPSIVVNGKYWTDASHAGSDAEIFKVVDFLIRKESK